MQLFLCSKFVFQKTSLLIAKNEPIKYIQKQLGHSTIKMTMDTYGHLMPDVYEQAINVLEEIASLKIDTNKTLIAV